jgi:hypothetical protein
MKVKCKVVRRRRALKVVCPNRAAHAKQLQTGLAGAIAVMPCSKGREFLLHAGPKCLTVGGFVETAPELLVLPGRQAFTQCSEMQRSGHHDRVFIGNRSNNSRPAMRRPEWPSRPLASPDQGHDRRVRCRRLRHLLLSTRDGHEALISTRISSRVCAIVVWQGVERLSAAWTGRSGWDRLRSQGFSGGEGRGKCAWEGNTPCAGAGPAGAANAFKDAFHKHRVVHIAYGSRHGDGHARNGFAPQRCR